MATYKAIQGYTVEKLSSDPSPVPEGKLWYNDTSNVFKVGIPGAAAWSAGGDLNTTKKAAGGSGSQTAALVIGGKASYNPAAIVNVESYDGSTWTEIADINTKRYDPFAGGTQTATILGGGFDSSSIDATEIWNGTSWTTNPATQGQAGYYRGYGGTSTDGICFGGNPFSVNCETWDGSAWAETGNLNTGRGLLSGAGASSTSALAFAGSEANPSPPPGSKISALCESWNGTSWTEVNNVNSAKWMRAGWGIQTAAMAAGGYPPTTATEIWNGTSWTTSPAALGSAKYNMASNIGTQALGLVAGGLPPNPSWLAATEEWNESPVSANTVTTS